MESETSGRAEITFPDDLLHNAPDVARDETGLFLRRRSTTEQKILIIKDQVRGKELEKQEKQSRLDNTRKEFDLMNERVMSLGKLAKAGAASRNELLRSKSDLQQIQTKLGDLEHQIPQIDVELSELQRRQDEVRLGFIADAEEEKVSTLNKIEQLDATLSAMTDRNRRTEVRAPIDGKVHRLFQTTVGGVVQGGQNLAQLVPTDAPISVEVQLSPKDRGRVWVDLPAVVKLSAYDYSQYGGIKARVTDISSDVLRNDHGDPFYRVKLKADSATFGDNAIVAGMAAQVDIITGQRTILDYLLAPVRDIQQKALREY